VLFWTALSIAGGIAFASFKYALFPDITFPVVVVTVRSFVDFDASGTETDVTGPLEAWLRTVDGVSSIDSLTYAGMVTIALHFKPGSDLEKAKRDVEDTIRAADVGRYQLQKLQAIEQAKMQAALRRGIGPGSAAEIAQYMNMRSQTAGKTPPLIYTVVTPINLNETAVAVYAVLSTTERLDRVSRIIEQRIAPALRTLPGVLRVDVLGTRVNGNPNVLVRYNGHEAVAVATIKNASANTLDVADAVNARVATLRERLPNLQIEQALSQASYIREASHATTDALLLAVALSVLVIWPFVRSWRATLISASAIPTSLLGAALVMRWFGFALDTITLLALALVVGVIVDDAIVAVENIVRHIEEGQTPHAAAHLANTEIGLTLTATTLTIVAVFAPIAQMPGTLGQFFRPFGITASAAVLFSLLVARTLSPALAAAMLQVRKQPSTHRGSRYPLYRQLLGWGLLHRKTVLTTAALVFLGGLAIIPLIPKGFIPHLDRGEFHVTFAMPPSTTSAKMTRIAATLEQSVREDPAVESIYTTIGARADEPTSGLLDVRLKTVRNAKTFMVENRVREHLIALPDVATSVEDVPFVGNGSSKPFTIALVGNDLAVLRRTGRALEHKLRATGDYLDMEVIGFSDDRVASPFIQHLDGQRAVSITADLAGGTQIGNATERATVIAHTLLPQGVSLSFGGVSSDALETFAGFGGTLLFSTAAILLVLMSLFRSVLEPLAVGVALPLSIVGALLALWITHSDFGLISLMGIIFLLGLVNKNAILLVDAIRRERATGLPRAEAVAAAGEQRLRPILMTTFATILGMLPIALGFGAGAELRQPMATAIIGGLLTSTMLSLLVVPVVYTIFDDLRGAKRRSRNPFAK
jgi:multidrug efflux pump subunit AcrB